MQLLHKEVQIQLRPVEKQQKIDRRPLDNYQLINLTLRSNSNCLPRQWIQPTELKLQFDICINNACILLLQPLAKQLRHQLLNCIALRGLFYHLQFTRRVFNLNWSYITCNKSISHDSHFHLTINTCINPFPWVQKIR